MKTPVTHSQFLQILNDEAIKKLRLDIEVVEAFPNTRITFGASILISEYNQITEYIHHLKKNLEHTYNITNFD